MNSELDWAKPVVLCRPALPRDTADILDFTRFIWEGHDYIPQVWAEWLAETDGLLAVAEYGGRTVGMARVVRLASGQWWMEGFRVDPQYQGLRIGSHIHEYIDRWWRENGDGVVRLMTSSQRVQVHHLCERLGYQKIAEVSAYGVAPLVGEAALRPISPQRLSEVAERLRRAATLTETHGLMDLGWRFVTPDVETLRPFAERGELWEWEAGEGFLVTWEDDDEEPTLALGLVACEWEMVVPLLLEARRLAGQRRKARLSWLAPLQPRLLDEIAKAGFTGLWERTGYLYQKAMESGSSH